MPQRRTNMLEKGREISKTESETAKDMEPPIHKSSADKKPRLFAPSFALSRHLTLWQKLCQMNQDTIRKWKRMPCRSSYRSMIVPSCSHCSHFSHFSHSHFASPRLATALRMPIIIPGCAAAAQLTSNFRSALEDTLTLKTSFNQNPYVRYIRYISM